MLKCFVLALALFLAPSSFGSQKGTDNFFRAVHQVETSGRLGPIRGDGGRALGPVQVHYESWLDVRAQVGGTYNDCANLNYSKKVLICYLNKYCPTALASGNYEIMARVWNGGPSGFRKESTVKYWKKVKKELEKSK